MLFLRLFDREEVCSFVIDTHSSTSSSTPAAAALLVLLLLLLLVLVDAAEGQACER